MTALLVTNIGELVTWDDERPILNDAAFVVDGGKIAWFGQRNQAPAADAVRDVGGAAVIPGFVDSHTHLVFAGDRSAEFEARMTGQPYEAGGIRTTVAATRAATDEQLAANVARHLAEMRAQGTTTVEIKSGYGLTTRDEARSLAIAQQFTEQTTFLGAHVVPSTSSGNVGPSEIAAYVELVTGEMLERCAPYARWIDVFCEDGAFGADESRAVLEAGIAAGLLPRIHANQLDLGPGVQLAAELGAPADHCTFLSDADIAAVVDSGIVVGLLPGVEFSTRQPYPDARRLLDAGVTVSLATDCNPGSSYTSSMPFCIAVAVRDMGMSPREALWSATRGGAVSLRLDEVGHLGVGAKADFAVLNAPSYVHLAYRPGVPLVVG